MLNKLQFQKLVADARIKGVNVKSIKTDWWCGRRDHDHFKVSYRNIYEGSGCKHCTISNFQNIGTWYARKVIGARGNVERLLKDIIPQESDKVGNLRVDLHFEIFSREDNKKIDVVFEFNGYQHYEFPNRFHETYRRFIKQCEDDNKKRVLLPSSGKIYIEVPYTLKYTQFQSHIVKEFNRQASALNLQMRLFFRGKLDHKFLGFYDLQLDF